VILYHFTSRWHLHHILKEGTVNRGDVPIHPSRGFRAPWFTENPDWSNQGWISGSSLDKTGVRLTFDFEEGDSDLRRWSEIAIEHGVKEIWYNTLNEVGGGDADKWWIYMSKAGVSMDLCTKIALRSADQKFGFSKTKDHHYNPETLRNIEGMLDTIYSNKPEGMISAISRFGVLTDQREPPIGHVYNATEGPEHAQVVQDLFHSNKPEVVELMKGKRTLAGLPPGNPKNKDSD